MEYYVPISFLNDYVFCPRSIYLHSVYGSYDDSTYHDTPQKRGKLAHESIDQGTYSTRKDVMMGTPVYSEELGLMGKIDVFFRDTGMLVERKFKINKVYSGNRFQLYAQMFCLQEMGYQVNRLFIHSLSDNRRYMINPPCGLEIDEFKATILGIQAAINDIPPQLDNKFKCERCIYRPLCH
jgi:CRISPR-associated exonuclease Cas4